MTAAAAAKQRGLSFQDPAERLLCRVYYGLLHDPASKWQTCFTHAELDDDEKDRERLPKICAFLHIKNPPLALLLLLALRVPGERDG